MDEQPNDKARWIPKRAAMGLPQKKLPKAAIPGYVPATIHLVWLLRTTEATQKRGQTATSKLTLFLIVYFNLKRIR